jgi:hypothetical protein
MLPVKATSQVDPYASGTEACSKSILSHIDSLLFYLGSDDYGTIQIYSDRSYSKAVFTRSFEERFRAEPDEESQSEEEPPGDQFIDPSRETPYKSSIALNMYSEYKEADGYQSMGEPDTVPHARLPQYKDQSLKKGSLFEGPDGHTRAHFNNFYLVEASEQQEIDYRRIKEERDCRVTLFADKKNSTPPVSHQKKRYSPRRDQEGSSRKNRTNNNYRKPCYSKVTEVAHPQSVSENRVVECVSTFVETLGELIEKLPPQERTKTLSRLKSNTKLKSLLDSPVSPDKETKGGDYFTFNELELSVKQLDVLPLNEIRLQSIGGMSKEDKVSVSTAETDLKDSSLSSQARSRPGKTSSIVESVYFSGQSSDRHLHGLSVNSVSSNVSHMRCEPKVVVKTRASKVSEHGGNKENDIHFPNEQRYTLSLQEPVAKSPKGYLKGRRLN